MKKVSVIIPTTGSDVFKKCLISVLNQTYDNVQAYIVIDGYQYREKVFDIINDLNIDNRNHWATLTLPENVGKTGFYGHRAYAGATHFVNSDYVLYLDQDCFYDSDHVKSMVDHIEENGLSWAYSLRKIVDVNGEYICNDDCESLGKWNPVLEYNHVDTNCYCVKTNIAIQVCQFWHGGWGQDRVFYKTISSVFPSFGCTGKYTVNYRLDGNENSVKSDFFNFWNSIVERKFLEEKFPWRN